MPSDPPHAGRQAAARPTDIGLQPGSWRSGRAGVLAGVLLWLGICMPSIAQEATSCSSDGARPPSALFERFINADCADCWSSAQTPRPPRGAIALDWILPGMQGDEAPLAPAANRDAQHRLQALHHRPPATVGAFTSPAAPAGRLRLRVAHGPALSGYIGASIELRPPAGIKKPFTSWLALVETLPAGTEGSPVERNLVRNVFQPDWGDIDVPARTRQGRSVESRSMNIPLGANPGRLRVIGWIEDADGQVRAIAESRCKPLR